MGKAFCRLHSHEFAKTGHCAARAHAVAVARACTAPHVHIPLQWAEHKRRQNWEHLKCAMVMQACRHCHGKHEFSPLPASSFGAQPPPCMMERLVYGTGPAAAAADGDSSEEQQLQLQRVLEWVESKATGSTDFALGSSLHGVPVPMPGVVVWCPDCRRMSVVSYTHYCNLVEKDAAAGAACEDDSAAEASPPRIQSMSEYYTRMCISAEMWMHMLNMTTAV